jgi:hypothetical protein
MYDIKPDFLVEALSHFIRGLLPLILVGIQICGRPESFRAQISFSGNVVKIQPALKLRSAEQLCFNFIFGVRCCEHPEIVIFRYGLDPAPSNSILRSS